MKKFNLEMLRLTSDEVLERNQLKNITEGQKYSCVCTGSIGAWTGNYKTNEEIVNAIAKWCASGKGSCLPFK